MKVARIVRALWRVPRSVLECMFYTHIYGLDIEHENIHLFITILQDASVNATQNNMKQ